MDTSITLSFITPGNTTRKHLGLDVLQNGSENMLTTSCLYQKVYNKACHPIHSSFNPMLQVKKCFIFTVVTQWACSNFSDFQVFDFQDTEMQTKLMQSFFGYFNSFGSSRNEQYSYQKKITLYSLVKHTLDRLSSKFYFDCFFWEFSLCFFVKAWIYDIKS